MQVVTSKYRTQDFIGLDSLLNLNGTNQRVEISNLDLQNANASFTGSQAHTYEMLFSISSVALVNTLSPRIISKGNLSVLNGGFSVGINTSNNVFIQTITNNSTANVTTTFTRPIQLNELVHLVVVFNVTEASVYINGVLVSTQTITDLTLRNLGNDRDLFIGYHPQGSTRHSPIRIGLLRVYNKALTANEILTQSKEPLFVTPSLAVNAVDLFTSKRNYLSIRI
jgi:hypothetical protein